MAEKNVRKGANYSTIFISVVMLQTVEFAEIKSLQE